MACGISGRQAQACMKKETTFGTYVTPDTFLSMVSEGIKRAVVLVEDGRLIGENFTTGKVKTGETSDGSVELTVHEAEIGKVLHGTLGANSDGTAGVSLLLIGYTGADAYAAVDNTAGVLTGVSGADSGSASTAWTFDTSNASYDTMTELAAAINAVSGWTGFATGDTGADTGDLADFTETAIKDTANSVNAMLVKQVDATAGAMYKHTVTPAASGTCLPSYSLCIDRVLGTDQAIGYSGVKFDSLSLSISAQSIITASLSVKGRAEETGKTYPSVSESTDVAFVGSKAYAFIDGVKMTEIESLNLNIANALDDPTVLGSIYRNEPIRGAATVTADGSLYLVSAEYLAQVANYQAGDTSEILIYIEGNLDSTSGAYSYILIRLNKVSWDDYSTNVAGADRMMTTFSATAVKPPTLSHIVCEIVDANSTY